MIREIRRIEFRGPDFAEWMQLRDAVLRKPLGLAYSEEDIAAEAGQDHLCFFSEGRIIAGLILYRMDHVSPNEPLSLPGDSVVFKMRQVAVDPDCQGRNIGTRLVRFSEEYAQNLGATHFILHAREVVVPFYEKLGYSVHGERFEEIGLPHRFMAKQFVDR